MNVLGDVFGFCGRREAFPHVPVFIHQKFGEVPFDRFGAQQARGFIFEMLIQRMGIGPIHVNFGKHRKGNVIVGLAKIQNFFVASWVLTAELVAGKSQHFKSLLVKLFVELFQPLKLGGESAFGSGIHDEQHVIFIG